VTEHAHNPPAQPHLVVTFNVAPPAIATIGIVLLLRALAFLCAEKARGSAAVDTHIHRDVNNQSGLIGLID